MKKIETITRIIWKLLQEGFKVVDYSEVIENSTVDAHFLIFVQLKHEELGTIDYNFRTYDLNSQFREIARPTT